LIFALGCSVKGLLLFWILFPLWHLRRDLGGIQRKYYAGRGENNMARPGKYGLCLLIAITVIVLVSFVEGSASACVGARQMAMGGTFVGIADDMSAVYWNPAGIAMLEQSSLHVTSTLNNRDTYNYDDFLAYVSPGYGDIAFGFSLIREHLGRPSDSGGYQAGTWFTGSIATPVADRLSIGANLRFETYSMRAKDEDLVLGSRWGLDLGILYRVNTKLSIGCLLQDAGLSNLEWNDGSSEVRRINIRPGIGYRPDPYTLIAFDIYDLGLQLLASGTYQGSGLCPRFGLERWLTPHLAARFGYYGIRPGEGAVTCGIGLHRGRYAIDYAYLDVATVPGHSGLGGTHQIGVTVKF